MEGPGPAAGHGSVDGAVVADGGGVVCGGLDTGQAVVLDEVVADVRLGKQLPGYYASALEMINRLPQLFFGA